MPIPIKCKCGKALTVKDQFAGKNVKCPACEATLKVPQVAAPQAQQVGDVSAGNPLNDLLDQEGFGKNIAAVCPNCMAEMAAEAVLCTKCGFNKSTGAVVKGHMVAGVDISAGAMALEKAADDMARADKMQRDMTSGAGMPWWILALILFVIGSASVLSIMAIMSTTAVSGNSGFNPMRSFLQLSGSGCAAVAFGAYIRMVMAGFKENRNVGLLCMTVLYLPVWVFGKPKERIAPFLVFLVMAIVAGVLLARATQV